MKLSECLNTADISTLRTIAERYGFTCSKHSKLALIQEILFSFRNHAFLSKYLPQWRREREQLMLRLCLDNRTLFSVDDLTAACNAVGCVEGTVDSAVIEGWLYPTTRYAGRLMYCIPDELHQALQEAIIEEFATHLQQSEDGPLTYQEEGTALARDLDVFLEYVEHHTVRLTQDGSMYKRNLMQVLELLEVSEEPLHGGWRFGYGRRFHDYPDRLALIYDYAFQQHFVEELTEGVLQIGETREQWKGLGMLERQRALIRFYLSTYRRPIPRLPQIIQLIAQTGRQWVRSDSMQAALSNLVNQYYYDSTQQVWQVRVLKMLVHLGVIRMGADESLQTWFQITKLGQQLLTPEALPVAEDDEVERRRVLVVQPNFEIVATADQPFVTAELAVFTELRQSGAIRLYRITEDRVQQGLSAGRSVMDWLEFVQNHSQTPIPGNVERTLAEWERQFLAEQTSTLDGPATGS